MIKKIRKSNTFEHYLLTVIPNNVDSNKINLLFNSYCLESILNQSDNNFIWIILNQNKDFKFPMTKTKYSNILLINYFDENISDKKIKKSILDRITSMTSPNIDFVITTSIRYNECYSTEFIKTIHNNIKPENKYLYFSPIILKNGNSYYMKKYGDKNLLTLIEKNDKNLKTIFDIFFNKSKLVTREMEKIKTSTPLVFKIDPSNEIIKNTTHVKLANYNLPINFKYRKMSNLSK